MSKLSQLYDLEKDIVGKDLNGVTLLPIYHSTQKAQIDVFLFNDATFAYAKEIEEDDSVTVIPTTFDSATRSSGIAPHPLCDKLIYVAGDYSSRVKSAKKNSADYYEKYILQLSNWVNSDYSDSIIETVYGYLKKGTMIADLISGGVLREEDRGYIDEKAKIAAIAQADCFVRFTVIDKETGAAQEVWKDKDLYDKYIAYCESISAQRELCYVTGQTIPVTYKHSVKFGVYKLKGSINCQLAEKTEFTEEDAEKIKHALETLFENDSSAARPDGSMCVEKLFWFRHNCKSGQCSSAKVHRSVKAEKLCENPKSADDYRFYYDQSLEGLTPEEIV